MPSITSQLYVPDQAIRLKPFTRFEVDLSNSLTHSLIGVWAFQNSVSNLIGIGEETVNGTVDIVGARGGNQLVTNGGQGDNFDTEIFAQENDSVFLIGQRSTGLNNYNVTGSHDGSNRMYLGYNTTTDDYFIGMGSTFTQTTPAPPSAIGDIVTLSISLDPDGTTCRIYENGLEEASFTGAGFTAASTAAFRIGARTTGQPGIWENGIHYCLYWRNRSLTAAENWSLFKNPYQIFKPALDTLLFWKGQTNQLLPLVNHYYG